MSKKNEKKRQTLANPFYGSDYMERLEEMESIDLRNNSLKIRIGAKYSKLIQRSDNIKIRKDSEVFFSEAPDEE